MDFNGEVFLVEDIAEILHIKPNTIHSKRWQEKTGCPLVKTWQEIDGREGRFLEMV